MSVKSRYVWMGGGLLAIAAGMAGYSFVASRDRIAENLLAEAQNAIEQRDFPQALSTLRQYVRRRPTDLPTLLLAARTARRAGPSWEPQVVDYLRAYERNGGKRADIDQEKRLRKAQAGDPEALATLAREVEENGEARGDSLAWEAIAQGYLGILESKARTGAAVDAAPQLPQAIHAVDQLLKTPLGDRDRAEAHFWSARIHHLAQQHAEAVQQLRRVVELSPKHPPAQQMLAMTIAQEAPLEALDILTTLAQDHPSDLGILFSLATLNRNLGRTADARQVLDQLLYLRPHEPQFLLELGKVELDEGRFSTAEALARRAALSMPKHPEVERLLAECRRLQGENNEDESRTTSPPSERVSRQESPTTVPGGAPWFQDATADSGVHFTYLNGEDSHQYTILESVGGGVALLDFDRDGRLDLFLPGGGYFDGTAKTVIKGAPCKFYRNLGNWRFADATASLGLDALGFYSHGVAVADFDCDGWPDLLVTGYGALSLFRNESNGAAGRKFVDVTAAVGLLDASWSTSAAFADFDGDRFPDLYVCHYVDWSFANNPVCKGQPAGVGRDVCPPQKFRPLRHAFFRNDRGRRFIDASVEQGLEAVGCGLGVVAADVNDDGRPDFYVANDASDNQLYFNRGGRLEECGLAAGVAVGEIGKYDGSMGVDVGDFDGSGRASLWVTNFQGDVHALYQNQGHESFLHRSHASGIAAIGQHYVGFGTCFLDIDNDGWEDLVIANGHVAQHPVLGSTYRQKPVLLRNVKSRDKRFFQEVTSRGGAFFDVPALGRGLAIGDLDDDGRSDLVFVHSNSPVALLRNIASESDPHRWIGIQLIGKEHRCIVGSTLQARCGDRTLTRFVKGGGSYLSSNDPRSLFGLGTCTGPVTLTVKWSWGQTETWSNLQPGAYWTIREGDPHPARAHERQPILDP